VVSSGSSVAVVARRTRRHLAEPLFRSAYSLILAELLTSGLGIFFWTVAARLYSTGDVGRGSALVAAMLTLANFSQVNLPMGFLRFLPGAGQRGAAWLRHVALFIATEPPGAVSPIWISRNVRPVVRAWTASEGDPLG
jgi:hypothetical protein